MSSFIEKAVRVRAFYPMRIGVFILALAVRIAAIEATGAGRIAFGDAGDYVMHARSVCEQKAYPERGNLPFFRAPGLPFFIAAVTACEPERTRAIKYGLAVCDALSALLLALIAARLWGSPLAGLIAGFLAALHPFFIASVTDIRSEPLFMLLLVAAMYFLRDKPAVAGVALGLAALTRPTALLCIPLFALFLLPRWKQVLYVIAAAALTLAPWTARNAIRYHELIAVNDAGGFNLWRGTHPEMLRIVRLDDAEERARAARAFETQTIPATERLVTQPTPAARSRAWARLAMENVRSTPIVRVTLWKVAEYWRPWLHPAEHGRGMVILSAIVFLGLYVLGAIGLARYPDKRIAIAVLVFFAAMWLAHLAYIPTIRLRMPLTDPLLIVFAAGVPLALRVPPAMRALLAYAAIVVPIALVALFLGKLQSFPMIADAIAWLRAAAAEWWAVPLFLILYAAFALLLLPVGPLSIAAALAWGWVIGGTIELVACTLAALIPFQLARRGLSERMQGWLARRGVDTGAFAEDDRVFALFLVRLVPVIPYVAVNYLAGLARFRTRDYVLATLVGSIPITFLFAWFVDTIGAGATGAATQVRIVLACAALAVFAITVRWLARRFARPR